MDLPLQIEYFPRAQGYNRGMYKVYEYNGICKTKNKLQENVLFVLVDAHHFMVDLRLGALGSGGGGDVHGAVVVVYFLSLDGVGL